MKSQILRWLTLQLSASADPLGKASFVRYDTGPSYFFLGLNALVFSHVARSSQRASRTVSTLPLSRPLAPQSAKAQLSSTCYVRSPLELYLIAKSPPAFIAPILHSVIHTMTITQVLRLPLYYSISVKVTHI